MHSPHYRMWRGTARIGGARWPSDGEISGQRNSQSNTPISIKIGIAHGNVRYYFRRKSGAAQGRGAHRDKAFETDRTDRKDLGAGGVR
jgi:hypothetical protein